MGEFSLPATNVPLEFHSAVAESKMDFSFAKVTLQPPPLNL